MKYESQVMRLAEKFISRYLSGKPGAELPIDDILVAYDNFVGRDKIDENSVLHLIIARFPDAKIRYGEIEVMENVTWFEKEPVPAIIIKPWAEKQLELRFATMTYLYPTYAENGVSISQFADWQKFSISSGGLIMEYGKIPVDVAEKYLRGNPNMIENDGKFYNKVVN